MRHLCTELSARIIAWTKHNSQQQSNNEGSQATFIILSASVWLYGNLWSRNVDVQESRMEEVVLWLAASYKWVLRVPWTAKRTDADILQEVWERQLLSSQKTWLLWAHHTETRRQRGARFDHRNDWRIKKTQRTTYQGLDQRYRELVEDDDGDVDRCSEWPYDMELNWTSCRQRS